MAKAKRTVKYIFDITRPEVEEFDVVHDVYATMWIENKRRGRFPIMKTDLEK